MSDQAADATLEITSAPRLRHLDGRTWMAKRVAQFRKQYVAALGLGDPGLLDMAAIERAAELTVFAELLRRAVLGGEPIPASQIVRAENVADRARRQLSLSPAPKTPPRPIRERLRTQAA